MTNLLLVVWRAYGVCRLLNSNSWRNLKGRCVKGESTVLYCIILVVSLVVLYAGEMRYDCMYSRRWNKGSSAKRSRFFVPSAT